MSGLVGCKDGKHGSPEKKMDTNSQRVLPNECKITEIDMGMISTK